MILAAADSARDNLSRRVLGRSLSPPLAGETAALLAAGALGVELSPVPAGNEREIDAAFAKFAAMKIAALMIAGDPYFVTRRDQLAGLELRYAVPHGA